MNKNSLTNKINAIFLVAVLIAGTIAAISPSSIIGAQAQEYYGQDKSYKKSDKKDVSVKSIKCDNVNVNVNGLELNRLLPSLGGLLIGREEDEGQYSANSYGNNGYSGQQSGYDNKNSFKFVCTNNNNNTVIGGGEPVPPTPPEPITSLTVNKEIFGCDDIFIEGTFTAMDCNLTNDSPEWISCEDPAISNTSFCQALTENFFDIEVLDDQNSQIAQFEGSAEGETIENLEPGTYTVNEIVVFGEHNNQLINRFLVEFECVGKGYDGGGILRLVNDVNIEYVICFEYEDEQGNDCSTITLAEGEARTCTVKNHIITGIDSGPSPAGGLTASNINTAGGLASSFSSPPTISQGTEDLSALEKTTS